MNKILKEFVETKIAEEKVSEKTIFVIKGFSQHESLNLDIEHLTDYSLEDYKNNDAQNLVANILSKVNNDHAKSYFCYYHDILFLEQKQIQGLINEYSIIIIDLNLFLELYIDTSSDVEKLKRTENLFNDYADNESNFIQDLFSHYEVYNDFVIYAYNEIKLDADKTILFNSGIKKEFDTCDEKNVSKQAIVISKNIQKEELIKVIVDRLNSNNKRIFIDLNAKSNNTYVNFYLSSFIKLGGQVYSIENVEWIPSIKNDYLYILKRINEQFNFKHFLIYEQPESGSNTTINVSQETIIDDIYRNSILANNQKNHKDIFLTASTGSGKSVIFQIPAIKLAEEQELVTLVITPLIGLMNDQVENIKKMTDKAVTINSEYSPEEKEKIKDQLMNREKSILYLSPETLLANGDISMLIGDRDIGLVVIDEAHTVATWGKSFRPDYWFLGDYLKRMRKKGEKSFPIAAFTATATFGGEEDMVYDIMNSLQMTVRKPYIGRVIRDDITFKIEKHVSDLDYRAEKEKTAIKTLEEFIIAGKKTLAYFPFVKQLKNFSSDLNKNHLGLVGSYHGRMDKGDKKSTVNKFMNNNIKAVLATKAFGMGIDINDIEYVYHFAPTGNLADYVQEIGRCARKSSLHGIATTDYFKEDFRYIKQLHGLSRIKNFEVVGVAQKILDIYLKNKKKNFMVSPEEFSHVFKDIADDQIDSKLKTTLLILKKDFENDQRINSYSLIFKPQSMFTKGLFLIKDNDIEFVKNSGLYQYLKIYQTKDHLKKFDGKDQLTSYMGDVYELDLKSLWSDKYRDISFGKFKYQFFSDSLRDLKLGEVFKSKILLQLDVRKGKKIDYVLERYTSFMNSFQEVIGFYKSEGKHFSIEDFVTKIKEFEPDIITNRNQGELLVSSILNMIHHIHFKGHMNNQSVFEYNKMTEKYSITTVNYQQKINRLNHHANKNLSAYKEQNHRTILIDNSRNKNKSKKMRKRPILVMAQIMELLGLCNYNIKAGDNPEFFIRVNSESALRKVVDSDYYASKTVQQVQQRHESSIKIMKYFFENLSTDKERWRLIENYFLGELTSDTIQ